VAAHVRQAVEQADRARGGQREADDVEPLPRRRRVGGQQPQGQDEADHAEGDVDPEQPPPVEPVQDHAADDRPQDRAHDDGEADHGHRAAEVATARRLHDQCRQQRQQQAAADALHDPERDQARRVPGQAAEHRAEQEHRQRHQPEPLAADPGLRPRHDRDHDAEREQVAGADPLDGGDGGVQVGRQRVEGEADDRRVEDDGQRAHDERRGHPHDVPVDHDGSLRCTNVSNSPDDTPAR
jgi:hypothetical protein